MCDMRIMKIECTFSTLHERERKKGIETVQSKEKLNANYKYNYVKFDAYSKYEYELPSTCMYVKVLVEEGKSVACEYEPSLRSAVCLCVRECVLEMLGKT